MRLLRPAIWLSSLAACTPIVDSKLDDLPREDAAVAWDDGGAEHRADPPGADAALAPGVDGERGLHDATVENDAASPPGASPGRIAPQLCIGVEHACALLPSGKVTCWGSAIEGALALQEGERATLRFSNLACGDFHTCGVTTDGRVVCVGRNRDGQSIPPAGSDFVEVTAGDAHSCARRDSGSVSCWGSDTSQQLQAPTELFASVAAGAGVTCGIVQVDGSLRCWGNPTGGRARPFVATGVRQIDVGGGQGCAIDDAFSLRCWGVGADEAPVLQATQVVVGGDFAGRGNSEACALLVDGRVRCWGGAAPRMLMGPYRAVGVGPGAICLLPTSGELACTTASEDDPIATRKPSLFPDEPL